MKQIPIKLGPLALLLTVISICLTVLAILTFTTARADMRLAEKYANTVRLRYELEAEGQRWLADEAALANDGDTFATVLEKDGSTLSIEAHTEQSGIVITKWRHEREWEEDTDIGKLWEGTPSFGN